MPDPGLSYANLFYYDSSDRLKDPGRVSRSHCHFARAQRRGQDCELNPPGPGYDNGEEKPASSVFVSSLRKMTFEEDMIYYYHLGLFRKKNSSLSPSALT